MAFGRKGNRNPSSRYSQIEEPWLDEQDSRGMEESPFGPEPDSYGVRDSYSRQASYGRADGYYSRREADDTRVMPDRDALRAGREEYTRRSAGKWRKSDPGYGKNQSFGDERRYRGHEERQDTYGYGERKDPASGGKDRDAYDETQEEPVTDAWDDPEYDARRDKEERRNERLSRKEERRKRRDARSGERDRYAEEDPYGYDEYDSRARSGKRGRPAGEDPYGYDEYDSHGRSGQDRPAASYRGEGRPGKGFVVKLVLLIIAAAALAIVWRFSRMQHVALTDILTNAGVSSHDGYQDFVIYGVDSREGNLTKDAHSDTIILCSMNRSTKEIRLVSVYRDTYLDNTNGEYRKATECYFFGGPSRSVNMLNRNLDLNLSDYITLDFNAVVKAVDLVGGVEVEVTEEELPYINGYQTENAEVTGAQITPVESAGYQHLNGIQALAYCRIRYTAGSDYKRTQRQRTVLTQVFESARQQGAVKLAQMVDTMLPYISTSFSTAELMSLAGAVSDYSLADSTGFPFDLQAANISAGDCVVPVNLAQNVSKLHAFLYQENGYTPSGTVQQISDEIAYTTGIY